MLGVRRASVTGVAGRQARSGAVTYARGTVTVLDRAQLESASCECYALLGKVAAELLLAPLGPPAADPGQREDRGRLHGRLHLGVPGRSPGSRPDGWLHNRRAAEGRDPRRYVGRVDSAPGPSLVLRSGPIGA